MKWVGVVVGVSLALVIGGTGCSGITTATHAQRPRSVGPTACTRATNMGPALVHVPTRMVRVSGGPFGVVTTADGRWSFVSLGGPIGVMSERGFVPRLVRRVTLPLGVSVGVALTHDGRYLLVTDGSTGATVLSVAGLERGAKDPVLGVLSAPARGGGAIEVTTTADDHYAFVSLEGDGELAVFDLRAALAANFYRSTFIGMIRLGQAPVGMALSPDGKWLYATSELAARPPGGQGTLSVIDVGRASTEPSRAVVATVAAQCSPVRVVVSRDGGTVWVTARESNELLGFSAAKLTSDPGHALVAKVTVGQSPVGVALVNGGRRIVVADSNRFDVRGARTGLTVVDTAAALAGRPAVLGTVHAGSFPREISLEPNGRTLLVANYGSGQVEAVDVRRLP